MNKLAIIIGKIVILISKLFNFGSGSTWPGHIALLLNPNFISDVFKKSKTKIILVIGTNGKTTTAKLVKSILEKDKKSVFLNQAGANLLNGIASAMISTSKIQGLINKDYAIFEVDENTVPLILKQITPDFIIALNLFRDQLDRYGEIDTIAKNWRKSLTDLPPTTTLILNADDPLITFLGQKIKAKTLYFGLNEEKYENNEKKSAADSVYCLFCQEKLSYNKTFFSHLGDWYCKSCKKQRPILNLSAYPLNPLYGTYNRYNVLAAVLLTKQIGISESTIKSALKSFTPAFGRQEVLKVNNKSVQIFLAKNPTSFNESLRTINSLSGRDLLIVLNDRIPDGRDISWIWDLDLENLLPKVANITVSGDRTYDMALRLRYEDMKDNLSVEPDLKKAIKIALSEAENKLYVLPTYSAMLETRKILTGKKIL